MLTEKDLENLTDEMLHYLAGYYTGMKLATDEMKKPKSTRELLELTIERWREIQCNKLINS